MTASKPIVPYGQRAGLLTSIKLVFVLLLSGANGLRYGLLWLLFGRHRRQSLRLQMFAAASRTVLRLMRADDLQMVAGLRTLSAELEAPFYRSLAKRALGFKTKLPPLEAPKHGAKLAPGLRAPECVWLWEVEGRTPEDPVLFFIHGGGFALAMSFPQVFWITDLAKALPQHRLSVLALDYSLSPYARYPTQLHEAFYGYEALAQTCNRIITLGDSAGGTLSGALALELANYPELRAKLFGQVYVSPWAELIPDQTGTIHTNSQSDWVDSMFGVRCAGWYVGEEIAPDASGHAKLKNTDPKADLRCATAKQLRAALPKNTACVWSQNEILADSIARFCSKANISQTYAEEGHVHDVTYFGHDNDSTRFVLGSLNKWLAATPAAAGTPTAAATTTATTATPAARATARPPAN